MQQPGGRIQQAPIAEVLKIVLRFRHCSGRPQRFRPSASMYYLIACLPERHGSPEKHGSFTQPSLRRPVRLAGLRPSLGWTRHFPAGFAEGLIVALDDGRTAVSATASAPAMSTSQSCRSMQRLLLRCSLGRQPRIAM
jgi:hypothetical protein